jgi:hypothetical protein
MLSNKTDACAILAGPRARDTPEVGCYPVRLTHAQYLQDHVQEILRKWDAIDDEIWAKVIVMERNRRVAKVR